MKVLKIFSLLLFATCTVTAGAAEKALLVADGNTVVFEQKASKYFQLKKVVSATDIDIKKARVLFIACSEEMPAAYRPALDEFLRSGGNVVIAGPRALEYTPKPYDMVPLTSFQGNYRVVWPRRVKAPGSIDTPEIMEIVSDGDRGVEVASSARGMRDVMIAVPLLKEKDRNTITFHARGSEFMNLLALEIKDNSGKRWYSFVPLKPERQHYKVSLADFLPEGWNKGDKPYPLLDPLQADTLYMGLNTMTTWHEKPMSFALSDVCQARAVGQYTPSSRLKTLRIPLMRAGIVYPSWIFDPFWGSKKQNAGWSIPPQFYEHPASAMGMDHKEGVPNKQVRIFRTEELLLPGNRPTESIYYGRGRYKNASVTLIGMDAAALSGDTASIGIVLRRALETVIRPRIAGVIINTTGAGADEISANPLVTACLVNPSGKTVTGMLHARAGNIPEKNVEVSLPPHSSKEIAVDMGEVPADFPFSMFRWEVSLRAEKYEDTVKDTVDAKRAMLDAFRYMADAQAMYPDGRISNHFFGDAYGVRAMFAYLSFLKENPGKRDAPITPDEIRRCAERFFDMLVARQHPYGGYPMGYSENTRVYNVADCGQISLAIAQSMQYINDPVRKAEYLASVIRFGKWAEKYYIDEKRSAELKITASNEYIRNRTQTGFYGLGPSGNKERLTGPSWVLSDILAAQIALSYLCTGSDHEYFRTIATRNGEFYARLRTAATGYYQAEALFWIWLDTQDAELKKIIRENLRETFLLPLQKGKENDMHELGSRSTLKALPLLYFRNFFGDDPGIRAVLLKYAWTFGSANSPSSMRQLAVNFPYPVHGESVGVAKYAALSSLWAMELLWPGCTLIRTTRN